MISIIPMIIRDSLVYHLSDDGSSFTNFESVFGSWAPYWTYPHEGGLWHNNTNRPNTSGPEIGSRHTVQYSVRTKVRVSRVKNNGPAVVESVIVINFCSTKSKIGVKITEPMITDLKNRYVFDYHHVYSSGQFVFFTAGGSWGCGWGEVNSITTQGIFAALDNRSTIYPYWSDVGSLHLIILRGITRCRTT